MRKMVSVECFQCKKEFQKTFSEYSRSERKGQRHFCSLSCSSKRRHIDTPSEGYWHLGLCSKNRRDEYTPFRWFLLRAIGRRGNKEVDLTLEDLKFIWDKQEGLCPLTGWELELPISTTGKWPECEWSHRASLDRIDSSKGYVKGNVRFIAVIANYARNSHTDGELIRFCKAVTRMAEG